MARSVAAFLAVLLALFEVGSCVKCYQCNTQNDKSCGDPFKPGNQLVDCNDNASVRYNQLYTYSILPAELFGSVPGAPRYCHKIVMESGTIIRNCLDGNPTDMNQTCRLMEKNTRVATKDKQIKYCSVCDKDNCNAAGSLSISLPLVLVTFVASYALYKE